MSKVNNEVINESVVGLDNAINQCSSNLSNLDSNIDSIDKEYDSIKALDGILLDTEEISSIGNMTVYLREKAQITGGEKIKDNIAKFKTHYARFKEEVESLSKDLAAAKEAAISIMAEKEALTSKLTESSSDTSRYDFESYESMDNKAGTISNTSSDSLNRNKDVNSLEQFRKSQDNKSTKSTPKTNNKSKGTFVKSDVKTSRGISYSAGKNSNTTSSHSRVYQKSFLEKITDSVEDITKGVSKKVPISSLTATDTKGITKSSAIPIVAGLGAAGASGVGYSTIHGMKNNNYDDDDDYDDIEEDEELLYEQSDETPDDKKL